MIIKIKKYLVIMVYKKVKREKNYKYGKDSYESKTDSLDLLNSVIFKWPFFLKQG
jgi:hypothetical protein